MQRFCWKATELLQVKLQQYVLDERQRIEPQSPQTLPDCMPNRLEWLSYKTPNDNIILTGREN